MTAIYFGIFISTSVFFISNDRACPPPLPKLFLGTQYHNQRQTSDHGPQDKDMLDEGGCSLALQALTLAVSALPNAAHPWE